jgi:four helix bundle protein
VSVLSNIAEGYERGGTAEFAQFLSIAKGSAGEVKAQLYVALDASYITSEVFDRLYSLSDETSRMIGGLMGYLRGSKIKGCKYK